MSDAIRINGNHYDWGSIVVKINDEEFHGFNSIRHNQGRERAKSYGTGRHRAPRGRTRGRYLATAGLGGPADSMEALRAALDDGTGNYGDTVFQIFVEAVEPSGKPLTLEVVDCVIASEDAAWEETSIDPLAETVEVDCMYIKKNGRTLFDNADGTR